MVSQIFFAFYNFLIILKKIQNNLEQIQLVWRFLVIRFRLCIFVRNIIEVMLWSYMLSGGTQFQFDIYFDHLIKAMSDWHLYYRGTVFPFLLNKYFVGEVL